MTALMKIHGKALRLFISAVGVAMLAGCATTPAGPKVPASDVRVYFHKPDGATEVARLRFDFRMDVDDLRSAAGAEGGNGLLIREARGEKFCARWVPTGCMKTIDASRTEFWALRVPAQTAPPVEAPAAADALKASGPYSYAAIPLVPIEPIYPRHAMIRCITGEAALGFILLPNGRPANIVVLQEEPNGIFVDAAEAALESSVFIPKMVDHRPVAAQAKFTYQFRRSNCTSG